MNATSSAAIANVAKDLIHHSEGTFQSTIERIVVGVVGKYYIQIIYSLFFCFSKIAFEWISNFGFCRKNRIGSKRRMMDENFSRNPFYNPTAEAVYIFNKWFGWFK